jgi:hypothetical protein
MAKCYEIIDVLDYQWVDTAAEAAAMALPRSLDQAANVLKIGEVKDTDGHELMMRMTRPRGFKSDGTPIWWSEAKDGAERLQRLYDYCKQDVRVERAVKKALRPLSKKEREVYLLDQRINDREYMLISNSYAPPKLWRMKEQGALMRLLWNSAMGLSLESLKPIRYVRGSNRKLDIQYLRLIRRRLQNSYPQIWTQISD